MYNCATAMKKVRINRIEMGLCSRCGKERDDKNFRLCSKCRNYCNNYNMRLRRGELITHTKKFEK